MRIGIDFDNTIVSYDKVFYCVALEQALIPESLSESKVAVRDYLRSKDQNNIWTELQGYVYGKRMLDADIFKGFFDFLAFAKENRIHLSIISHKTVYPYEGEKFNLHNAAREFISRRLLKGKSDVISDRNIFFELTQKDKVLRVEKEKCDYFIDDLPEIFILEDFPHSTIKCLFDPDDGIQDFKADFKFSEWEDIVLHLQHDISRR